MCIVQRASIQILRLFKVLFKTDNIQSILGTGWIEVDKIARQETCTIYNALERMPFQIK